MELKKSACDPIFYSLFFISYCVLLLSGCRESDKPVVQEGAPTRADHAALTTPYPATRPARTPTTAPFAALNIPGLPNAHIVTAKVICGAQPEGDVAFKALHDLGVKTIITVDGATPDVDAARKYDMRYIHLPIGYDGVSEKAGREIAKAIDEMPGPIYLHCHHGKHRSAAAAAVACVYNGDLSPSLANSLLTTMGTGENYKGLWRDALAARPLDPAELKDLKVEYHEKTQIDNLARAMVDIDATYDNLKLIQKSGWQTPANHPDLDPAHEALQLQERLHELTRAEWLKSRPEHFQSLLSDSDAATKTLYEALSAKPADTTAATASMPAVGKSCLSCHSTYRD